MLFGLEEKLDGKKLSQNRHNTSSSKHFFPHTSNDFHSRINYSEPINQKRTFTSSKVGSTQNEKKIAENIPNNRYIFTEQYITASK